VRTYLIHLLNWAGEVPLTNAKNLDPSFSVYLVNSRLDGMERSLAPSTMKKTCEYTRLFFYFIKGENPVKYKAITPSWIDTLRPITSKSIRTEFKEHSFYPIDMVRKLAEAPVYTIAEERDRAAACFLYLSAMRVEAFVSMPMSCVNLKNYSVRQFPQEGVRTKNRIAAITQLLRIPELLEIVREWDNKVRIINPYPNGLWYPPLDADGVVMPQDHMNWDSRTTILRKSLQKLCKQAGIKYLPPHNFRHGHIYYMMKKVKDMKELKALSQNVMHSSVAITDGIYGKLISNDIETIYTEYGEEESE
jgi:integrase